MAKTTIIEATELTEFFRDRVKVALAHQALAASEITEYYLVNLLKDFRRTEKLFNYESDWVEKPLAILLLEAMKGDTATRTRCLKQLGDTALYVAGFFADNFNRQLVDQHYYIAMGGSAYGSLAHMMSDEPTFGELFHELSENFSAFVGVIGNVAPWNEPTNNINLLRMYERWLATGDKHLGELLREKGIDTENTSSEKKMQ